MSASKNSAKSRLLPKSTKDLLKDHVLGADYELSLAWVSPERMHELNLLYRGKDKPTNVLSFPLSETEGEILLCAEQMSEAEVIPLFIHGLLHLKGMRHGSRMENEERRVVNFLILNATNHRRRP